MFTNFKLFGRGELNFFRIPMALPDFYVACEKIGMNEEQILKWKRLRSFNTLFKVPWNSENIVPDVKYIIITKDKENNKTSFTWTSYDDADDNCLDIINVTEEDLDFWDLKHNVSKKYNL